MLLSLPELSSQRLRLGFMTFPLIVKHPNNFSMSTPMSSKNATVGTLLRVQFTAGLAFHKIATDQVINVCLTKGL